VRKLSTSSKYCRSKSRITSPQAVSRHWLPDTARWSVHSTLYQVHLLSSALLSPGSWSWSGKDGLLTPLPVYNSIVKWFKIIFVCFTIIPYNRNHGYCLFTVNIFDYASCDVRTVLLGRLHPGMSNYGLSLLLVAVTRERRYGPSRLRVNDDDDLGCSS